MEKLNKIEINDVSVFSGLGEVATALQGKYAKKYGSNYQLVMIKDICFVTTQGDCTIQLPAHYKFAYSDGITGTDRHIVDENTNTISVVGVSSFFFTLRSNNQINKDRGI